MPDYFERIVNAQTGEVTIRPWTAEEIATANPPPTNAEVSAERDRRIALGSTFNVMGYGPIRISGDDTTVRNLQGLAFAAQLRLAQGDDATTTAFRDDDNVIHLLLPSQVINLWSQGAAFVSAVFAAAWALKDNPAGIPADFINDEYWP